jgi:hypothetical protein
LEDRFDVVIRPDGLDAFDVEYGRARTEIVEGIPLRVLPLERIIASKRAAKRLKDLAQLPALEAALAVQFDREPSGESDSSWTLRSQAYLLEASRTADELPDDRASAEEADAISTSFDVALVDVRLGTREDGIEVGRRMLAEKRASRVLLVTGFRETWDVARAQDVGPLLDRADLPGALFEALAKIAFEAGAR